MLFRGKETLKKTIMDQLSQFIQDNPDPRELKRALVQMVLQDTERSRVFAGILWLH